MGTRRHIALATLALLLAWTPAVADEQPAAGEEAPPVPAFEEARPARDAEAAPVAARAGDLDEREARTRRVLQRPAPRSLSEALRRLDNVRVDVDFREMPLPDAVAFIGRLAGFNVIVGPELQREGLDALPTITLKLRKASLKQVAELVTRFTDTRLVLQEGILSFTTPEASRGKPILRIYSIGELTVRLRNFPGPDLNLRPSGAEFEDEEESDVENPWSDPDEIVDMIKRFVESESWETEGVSIWADTRKLVVRQTPEVQRKVARFLMLLRASR